jgi:tellurite resistance protein TerC
MIPTILPWAGFLALVAALLAIDLGIFHRKAHEVHRREALIWSVVWISLALAFGAGMFVVRGTDDGIRWITGYLIEKSLSVDNVFIFILIFSTFAVPPRYQHRVLFWGILGAIIMRGILIGVGAALIHNFHFIIYVFGAFLVFTGLRFLRSHEEAPSLEDNRLVRIARRIFPTTEGYEGQKFFVRRNGVLFMTPLLLVLLLVESTDVIFAVDSIPAIFAVTTDPFIVFTSNIFAILGLRALYFVLSSYLLGLLYLKPALAAILVFVGTKMLISDFYKFDPLVSLAVIIVILGAAIVASIVVQRRRIAAIEAEKVA